MPKSILASASLSLKKDQRIRKRRDFLRVQRVGYRSFGKFTIVIAQRINNAPGRVGITVPKKVGAAHVRNKIKRRIRHILRVNSDLFWGKALVIIARDSAGRVSFSDLQSDIVESCNRLSRNRAHAASKSSGLLKKIA